MKSNTSETNEGLGYHTDQLVESMHQHANKKISNSNYHVKDEFSDIQGEKLRAGINHINSYNLSKY